MTEIILQTPLLVAIGLVIGMFGTMIGVGGGFLAVPLLIIAFSFDSQTAVGTSLGMVLLNAVSGTVAYLRQKRVDLNIGTRFMLVTVPSAVAGAFISDYLSDNLLKALLSILLMLTAIYIIRRPQYYKTKVTNSGYARRMVDTRGEVFEYRVDMRVGYAISILVGVISSVFGVGGGIIHVPAMIALLGIPVHIAVSTSTFILTFTSLAGALSHAALDNIRLDFMIPLGIGAIIGAQLGARIARRTKSVIIVRILGLALLAVGVRLLLTIL